MSHHYCFQGDDIAIRRRDEFLGNTLVVTFASRKRPKDVEATEGFGESYFSKREIPAIHIMRLKNHWWQTREMEQVFEFYQQQNFRNRFQKIVSYGSSMGGHGAILFSKIMEFDRVVAFSPQFAINGRNALWRPEWAMDTARTSEIYRIEDCISHSSDIRIAFDPLEHFDVVHLKAIARLRKVIEMKVPWGGHGVANLLNRINLLDEILTALLFENNYTPSELTRRVRGRRRRYRAFDERVTKILERRK